MCVCVPPHAEWLAGHGVCGERERPELSASPLLSGLGSDMQPARERQDDTHIQKTYV